MLNKFHIMKFIENSIPLFFILFTFSCHQKEEVHISNTIMFSEKLYELKQDKPFNGIVYNTYGNGKREYEGVYENGLPDGRLIYWYENGIIKREGELKKGIPIGRWKEYDLDGSLKSQVDH